jgi:hypothetical protein
MKARNLYRFLFASTLCGLLFTACKKSSSSSSNDTSQADLQTQADDESRVSTETDAAFNDVNTTMEQQVSITGSSQDRTVRYGVTVDGGNQDTVKNSLICNATVTYDTTDNPHTITITYNGKTSDSLRIRTGSIVISWVPGTRWTTAGDQITVQFNNLKIVRIFDNKAIIFNGTHTYTNVTGGSLLSLTSNSATPITHTITSSNMSITFDDGSQRTWSFARQRTYSYNNGFTIQETGTHTSGSLNDISEWGTNRFGNSFTAQITTPLTAQVCNNSLQVTAGVYILTNNSGVFTLTFGLDANGNPISGCSLTNVYYLQLVWAGAGGKTYSITLPY